MKRLRAFASVVVVAAGLVTAAVSTPASATVTAAAGVRWGPCPTYSDEELDGQSRGRDLATVRKELARRHCGTVRVPLDHGQPYGRQADIAVTRFPAKNPAKRLGVLAVNPGGPGGSGVLLPADVSLGQARELANRFDLIGFDPRGVGASTPRLTCEPIVGEVTTDREQARQSAVTVATLVGACAGQDPALTASLTTANIARDLDRIRQALGEQKISFLGFSWGTMLGATYQTLYPKQVNRMVLDSVVRPEVRIDREDDDVVRAQEVNHHRFTTWLAAYHESFGLGSTQTQIEAQLERIKQFFTENPQDVPAIGDFGDEFTVAFHSTGDSQKWKKQAADLIVLKKIVDAGRQPGAASIPARRMSQQPPEFLNNSVNRAVLCNADLGIRTFDAWFDRWEERRRTLPVAGLIALNFPFCAGWPHPVQPEQVSRTGAPVLSVGHKLESVTPLSWQREMVARVGGASLVVDDDVHASLIDVPCAGNAVRFLVSGRQPAGACDGVALPKPGNPRR